MYLLNKVQSHKCTQVQTVKLFAPFIHLMNFSKNYQQEHHIHTSRTEISLKVIAASQESFWESKKYCLKKIICI